MRFERMIAALKKIKRDDDTAATAVEYGLVIAFGSLLLVAAVASMDVPIQNFVEDMGALLGV